MRFLPLVALLLLSCGGSSQSPAALTITEQQLQYLEKPRDYALRSIAQHGQTFYRPEADIALYKTRDGAVVGYLLEQGRCSTVLTQLLPNTESQAKAFIAAKVARNHGTLFSTKDSVSFRYYTARQGGDDYLVAQSFLN